MDKHSLRYIFSSQLSSLLGPGKSMSQRKLSALMGVRPNTVSDWCSGKTFPGYDTVDEIAETLGISSQWLFGATETKDQLFVKGVTALQKMQSMEALQTAIETLETIVEADSEKMNRSANQKKKA